MDKKNRKKIVENKKPEATEKKSDKAVKGQAEKARNPAKPKKRITFVCTGNTCRSAMAKFIFADCLKKEKLNTKYIADSAGLAAFDGDGMALNAQKALDCLKIKHTVHKAKRLSLELINKSELIVCMTGEHVNALKPLQLRSSKCVAIKDLIIGGKDVPDPYGQDLDVYIQTAEYLSGAMKNIIEYLERYFFKENK